MKPPSTRVATALKFTNCYDGIERFLNFYGKENSWWRCIRKDEETLYRWDDPIHQGKAALQMNGPERYHLTAKRISFPVTYADFYVVIEWEKSLLTLLLDDIKSGAHNACWEIEIMPEWLEALQTCSYPHNVSPM